MTNKTLTFRKISFGADPELFFTKDGNILESSAVIPKNGVKYEDKTWSQRVRNGGGGKIIRDGVQVELNPRPYICIANFANEMSLCFRGLLQLTKEKDVGVDFSANVQLSDEDFARLDDSSKEFGCGPTKNTHSDSDSTIKVDPTKFQGRSAGGHIHLGSPVETAVTTSDDVKTIQKTLASPDKLVPVLDLIVGNTAVMIDRDPANAERRKVYGKAGEYRTPPHGLEYRTLSNFWLRSYPLMSFMMQLSRMAVNIVADGRENELLATVNMSKVRKAINDNDIKQAQKNFDKMVDVLVGMSNYEHPIKKTNKELVRHFLTKPMEYWWEHDPMEHWATLPDGHGGAWDSFLKNEVQKDLDSSKKN